MESWYHQHSMAPGSQLQDWMISELLNDLGISLYLHVEQCSRHSSPFYPSSLGWNKGNSCFFPYFDIFNEKLKNSLGIKKK